MCRCPIHNCSGNGKCSSVDGSCVCSANWTGVACNDSLQWEIDSLNSTFSMIAATHTSSWNEVFSHTSVNSILSEDGLSLTKSISSLIAHCGNDNNCLSNVHSVTHNCRNCGIAILVLCTIVTASVVIHIFICVGLKERKRHTVNYFPVQRRKQRKRREKFTSTSGTSSE